MFLRNLGTCKRSTDGNRKEIDPRLFRKGCVDETKMKPVIDETMADSDASLYFTTSSTELKERLIESLADSWLRYSEAESAVSRCSTKQVENVVAVEPTTMRHEWMTRAIERVKERLHYQFRKDVVAKDIVDQATNLAESKISQGEDILGVAGVTTKGRQGTSFSLFDQFQAGGMKFFCWEGVKEGGRSTEEALSDLEGAEFVEDLFPHWESSIRQFLVDSCKTHANEVLKLYEKWYGKARNSADFQFQSFSLDMTAHALQIASDEAQPPNIHEASMILALDMFYDMLVGGSCQQGKRLSDIGETIFAFLGKKHTCASLRRFDPQAKCFRLWLPTLSTDTTLPLLSLKLSGEDSSLVIGYVVSLCQSLDLFGLSTLRSILLTTRTHCFPWNVCNSSCTEAAGWFLEGMSRVLGLETVDFEAVLSLLEGLEIIVSGMGTEKIKRDVFNNHHGTIVSVQSMLGRTNMKIPSSIKARAFCLIDKLEDEPSSTTSYR